MDRNRYDVLLYENELWRVGRYSGHPDVVNIINGNIVPPQSAEAIKILENGTFVFNLNDLKETIINTINDDSEFDTDIVVGDLVKIVDVSLDDAWHSCWAGDESTTVNLWGVFKVVACAELNPDCESYRTVLRAPGTPDTYTKAFKLKKVGTTA